MIIIILLYLLPSFTKAFINKMPFWYPILEKDHSLLHKPKLINFMDEPLVAYYKNRNSLVIHSDVCPHMGCSFAKGGWINSKRNLQCPYHGFEFDEGRFVSIPTCSLNNNINITNKIIKNSSKGLHKYNLLEKNGYYYVAPFGEALTEPYYPPEHYDPEFIKITGVRELDCSTDSLVENLLDMLHISYVHSFGNIDMPLARNIEYEDIGEYGGRSIFEYTPNKMTISRLLGNTENVIVENEFYLPTTTITRVYAGPITKVVYTQSMPISENKTLLFWTVYRNFWKEIPELGNYIMKTLMEKTIDEDASILSRCYENRRVGFLTKFDITIRKYREKKSYYI